MKSTIKKIKPVPQESSDVPSVTQKGIHFDKNNQLENSQPLHLSTWSSETSSNSTKLVGKRFPKKFVICNNVSLIIFAVLLIISQIGQTILSLYVFQIPYYDLYSGFWTGAYYIITAILSLVTMDSESTCLRAIAFVMEIFGIFAGSAIIVFNALKLQITCPSESLNTTVLSSINSPNMCWVYSIIYIQVPLMLLSLICMIICLVYTLRIACVKNLISNQSTQSSTESITINDQS